MKKSILIPFLFIGLLAFASCKGTSENKTTTGADTVQTEKPQPGTIHLTRAEFLKKVADYENHSIYIYKVDVDKEPELAKAFGIQSIPTLWFVPMKGEPQVSMGALSKEQLKGYIDKVLLKP